MRVPIACTANKLVRERLELLISLGINFERDVKKEENKKAPQLGYTLWLHLDHLPNFTMEIETVDAENDLYHLYYNGIQITTILFKTPEWSRFVTYDLHESDIASARIAPPVLRPAASSAAATAESSMAASSSVLIPISYDAPPKPEVLQQLKRLGFKTNEIVEMGKFYKLAVPCDSRISLSHSPFGSYPVTYTLSFNGIVVLTITHTHTSSSTRIKVKLDPKDLDKAFETEGRAAILFERERGGLDPVSSAKMASIAEASKSAVSISEAVMKMGGAVMPATVVPSTSVAAARGAAADTTPATTVASRTRAAAASGGAGGDDPIDETDDEDPHAILSASASSLGATSATSLSSTLDKTRHTLNTLLKRACTLYFHGGLEAGYFDEFKMLLSKIHEINIRHSRSVDTVVSTNPAYQLLLSELPGWTMTKAKEAELKAREKSPLDARYAAASRGLDATALAAIGLLGAPRADSSKSSGENVMELAAILARLGRG